MAAVKLISFDLCPFVQRSVIALHEKGVPFEVEYIDLNQKPPWFLEISPLGKVPVLVVDGVGGPSGKGEPLFESAVINEYLDETAGGRRLMPEDPLERARNRMWIEYSSGLLIDIWKASVATDEETTRQHALAVRGMVERISAQVKGPFFSGEHLSLVDVAASTAMMRVLWLHQVAPELEMLPKGSRAQAWTEALMGHPSVRASIFDGMRDRFMAYMKGDRSPTLRTAPSWLGQRVA